MSYEIQAYFAGEPFPMSEYEAFVQRSLSVGGTWQYSKERKLDLSQFSELHAYRVRSGQDVASDAYDARKDFSLYVSLHRKHPQRNDPALQRFSHYINIDLGGGGSSLGLSVFFLTAAAAFNCFRDGAVLDEESLEPENVEVYYARDEFLRHAARAMRNWPNSNNWLAEVVDAQGNFIE